MGNLSVYLRTKCPSSRNRSTLILWFWCITLQLLLNLPCILSDDLTPQIFPIEPVTLIYGRDPLEMYCSTNNDIFSSDDLVFKVNSQELTAFTEKVNKTTIKLTIEKPEKQSNIYICLNLKSKHNELRNVLVDSPPDNVSDFKCVSQNLESLICSWSSPSKFSKINYTLTYIVNQQEYKCAIYKSQSKGITSWRASWNLTSNPRYRQQEKTFLFILEGTSYLGINVQNITIDHFSVIMPNPPSKLQIIKTDTNSVTLQWQVPSVLVDLGPGVYHRIVYQIAKIDSTDTFHEVNTSTLPIKPPGYKNSLQTKPFKFKFDLPYPYMSYDIRIYIKSVYATKDEFWSNFTYIIVSTLGERPIKPPQLVDGAFHQALYKKYRVINVYWKQVELYEEAGANFTYRALVEQGTHTSTVFPDKNKSMSYIVLDKASLGEIHVTVWSQNDNGSSINSSHLYIPSAENTSLALTSFTKLAYENGTYELSWVNEDKLDNYTLFWCQYNATKICNGRLDFEVLKGGKSNHTIDLPKESRYQFAISGNKGMISSGMVWASKCEISREGLDMFQFPMELSNDAPGSTYVKLKWNMECALQHGIITGYKINYCTRVKTSSFCDPTVKNQSIYISNPKQMETNITDLLPSLTYQFTIDLNTTKGLKTIINTTAAVTTLEDTPTKPRNVAITDIKNDSFIVSWDPPEHRNGKIGKYIIYNFNQKLKEITQLENGNSDVEKYTRQSNTLRGLNPFTNYSISVQACNTAIEKCSETGLNDAIVSMTKIGRPSQLKAPIVKSNPDIVKWDKPAIAGGIVDLYQIRVIKDNSKEEIINVTDLYYSTLHCNNVNSNKDYQVRAVNFIEDDNNNYEAYFGDWSDSSTVSCNRSEGLTTIFIVIGVISMLALVYGSIKLSKWKLDRDDLKPPKFPDTLRIPEKDCPKYTSGYGGWSPANKDDKPSSDEMLLLPGNKTMVSTSDMKKNDTENCAVSDHTDSTALSDSSKGPIDRQPSISNASSNSSLHSDHDLKDDESPTIEDEDNISDSNSGSSSETLPYLRETEFKKNPATGYVQTGNEASNGYVQQGTAPKPQTASTSYVMAGLSPPIFTTGVTPSAITSNQKPPSGYVRAEDLQTRPTNPMKLAPSPTKVFGPESLPTLSPLSVSSKRDDCGYIQLQSLDSSLKPTVRNALPMSQQRSGGYVSPEDAVLNKHLSNILSPASEDEPAMLDPTMSADAYCRFSWNTDPANDNIHSLLTDSSTVNPSKN